ncbi:hypothetical protein [Haloferula sp. BvORR071]|uniref:hypothetical protein n=1 Tax=Haloferula sp. BvORR071 TaxID=1396141 RepID=UPI00055599F9|nr:hypothetical protein [Haloferula sp. BvORR071]
MNTQRRLWISLLTLAGSAAAAPQAEVRCTDGSVFKGTLMEIGSDRAIIDADFFSKPAPLKLDHVLEINLPAEGGKFTGDHIANATLSNGDTLRGELTGVTDSEISLRTWYGAELKLRRTMVDTLEIEDRPDILYTGPTGLEGWSLEKKDGWAYEDGVLRSKSAGAISRKIELPAKAHFAFDVAWRSNPRFRFLFYSDNAEAKEPENCYILSVVSGRYVELKKKRSAPSIFQPIGTPQPIPEFLSREKVRFDLLVDRKTGVIQLQINGRVAVDWLDPDPQGGRMGGGIHFDAADSSPLKFSRIEVSSWDGVIQGKAEREDGGGGGFLDEEDEPQEKKAEPDPDPNRIRLRNSDHVEGKMLGIENGKVKLQTKYGEMNLPVSRLRSFPLRTKKERDDFTLGLYEKPKRYNGDIRAWFTDGSHVTFRLESANGDRLKGFSQPLGQVDFDAKAFSRIEFNLYDPDLEALRTSSER